MYDFAMRKKYMDEKLPSNVEADYVTGVLTKSPSPVISPKHVTEALLKQVQVDDLLT